MGLQERKELIGQKNNEKHNNYGALLLGLGVTFSVAGGYNTFLRTGEIDPPAHNKLPYCQLARWWTG